MPTRSQLLILTIISTLGGSFAALLVIGIFSGDFTFAAVNLVIIVAIFLSVFLFHGSKPKKQKRAGEVHVGGELNPEFKSQYYVDSNGNFFIRKKQKISC